MTIEKLYQYKNGIIRVTQPKSCDREKLKKDTEVFLKKVIFRRDEHGNTNTSRAV